ncbi:MAG: primosomal protein N' [Deltaproteobacteria bacterium]|jgi:primosomal protein N' (replication factor Y) (superfamily II helicase)|nr:primosomal protein N' [Deltaproteobacteria bacterium]
MRYAEIAIPTPVHGTFTYSIGDCEGLIPGMRVVVPFRRKKVVGICFQITDKPPLELNPKSIKSIDSRLDDEPSLSSSMIKLMEWMSRYYLTPIGEVCRASLPSRMMRLGMPKTTRPMSPHEMRSIDDGKIVLNADQKNAIDTIAQSLQDRESKTYLIHGITGSGKTEVYLRLFAELAKSGRRGLLLVPEIGLTPLLTGRATAKFGDKVAVYHSGLTDAQRHEQWQKIKDGKVDVVIGTRSSLFAPIPDLGAIVVDEEHDGSYKQDDGFTYHARDAAVMRAHMEGACTILGSATPSLESLSNVKNGKYSKLELPLRTKNASLPSIELVDMRRDRIKKKAEPSEGMRRMSELQSLSPELYDAIDDTLKASEQVLLYVGRRGFASSVQCTACGEVFTCPNCDIALTAHRQSKISGGVLTCHYCDYHINTPSACKSCGSEELIPLGYGTERLEGEIADFFPNARIARLDSDIISKPSLRRKILDDMRRGKIDILIGTQMITKGHDFPSITLVGVISADLTLAIPDFRSAEKTFQLITQVSGRAGRGSRPGRVIIQTRQPEHYSFLAASNHDCDEFTNSELIHREEMFYPPFSRLANIRLSSTSKELASKSAGDVAKKLDEILRGMNRETNIRILGPAPAIIEKLRGRYRWQILIKAPNPALLTSFLSGVHSKIKRLVPSKVRINIDVDPVNMM